MLDVSKSFVDTGVTPVNWDTLFNASHKTRYLFIIDDVRYDENDIYATPVIERSYTLQPAIGRCGTSTLTLTIKPKAGTTIPKAAPVLAYCRLTNQTGTQVTAWYPLGKFWITKRRGSSNLLELTCRDTMIKANQTYQDKTSFAEWPVNVVDVLNEIAAIMGVEFDARNVYNTTDMVDYPNEDTPICTVLSMIAAAQGGIFIMSPDDRLRLVPYPDDQTVAVQHIGTRYSRYEALSAGRKTVSRVTLNDIAGNQFTYGDNSGIEITADCDYATDEIACRVATGLQYKNGTIYAQHASYDDGTVILSDMLGVLGKGHFPYELTGAYIDPRVELGDVISITRKGETVKCICGEIRTMCTQYFVSDVSFGVEEDDEEEFPYSDPSARDAEEYISTTKAYFGNRINRKEGFVSEFVKNNEVVARFTANANLFSMQQKVDNAWRDRIYFDPVAGKYKITGDVEIEGKVTFEDLATRGKTTIHGDNVTTGTLNTNQVKIAGSDNFMWNEEYIVAKNPSNANQQIRYGKYDGSNMGIAFTTDGGKTWQSVIGFNGVVLRAGSVTQEMLSSDIDLNPIADGKTAPTSVSEGKLWIDTSVTPPVLKRYNATSKTWVAVNETDLTEVNRRLSAAEQKITDSASISTVTSSSTFVTLQNTANGAKSTADSASTAAANAQSTADSAKATANSAAATVASYEQRLSTAEQKITDSAIISTVTSSSTFTNALTGKVSKTEVISCINQTAETITISASKINFKGAVITDGTLTTGNWTFDSNGSSYSGGGVGVNMTVLSGSFVGSDSSGTRAFYGSSNCDVQYGADYEYDAYVRAGAIKFITHKDLYGDWSMNTYGTAYCRLSSGGEFTFLCGEASSGDPRGNLGSSSQRWDTVYVNALHQGSSKHVKHDIQTMPDMGSVIDGLRPVTFIYNNDKAGRTQYGLVYEEAIDVFDYVCLPWKTNDVNDIGIDYTKLITVLLEGIKGLRARVKKLEESAA